MERWYWIELIGFDNEKEDYGVGDFLGRNVSTDGVSLLFSHIDFLFSEEAMLPETACSYFAHEYNKERRRQDWTRSQLKGLVDCLKNRGVKVFFATFDMTRAITDSEWLCRNSLGGTERLLNPIKPLATGGTVGDRIIERIDAVISFYGFDGLQLADGLSSARLSIENGDFSLALCLESGIKFPASQMSDEPTVYQKRRRWILKNKRYEWTVFLSEKWGEFYRKLFDKIEKPIMFNNAWTRDSFEALYRYGLDYNRCCIDKAFAVMIEDNSATRAITAREDEAGVEHTLADRAAFTYEYALMEQDIRLVTKGLKQITLTPISDTMEQWDAIRHCPTELSRSIVRRYNNFVYRGGFERTCDAPHYCLSDGVPSQDWQWLARQESYLIPTPDFIPGFVSVHNGASLYREVKNFIEGASSYGSLLLSSLFSSGLNIGATVDLSEVGIIDKAVCLLVTNLSAYSEEEKKTLEGTALPILAIGEDVSLNLPCSAKYEGKKVSAALYNTEITPNFGALAAVDRVKRRKKILHGEIWTEPLSCDRVDYAFYREMCRILNESFDLDRSLDEEVKVTSYISGEEKYILLSNDAYTYKLPTVTLSEEVESACALLKDKGYRVKVKEREITVRIPPRSVEIVKIS